jgi:F-type H+-transporting ATPase subunit b
MTTTNRISRFTAIGFLAVVLVFPLALFAARGQGAGTAPEQSAPEHSQPSEPTVHSPGPGRQLAHESREAAGQEKDEMEEFKHSSAVSWISRKLHVSLQNAYWLSVILNFAVIGMALIWAAREILPGIFRDRTAAIQKAMQEAQKASEEARHKLAEIESRLRKLDDEIGAIRDAAQKEGAAEEARIQAAAQEDARKIISSAEQEIVAAAKAARRQLTAHAADLAVGLAKKQIHVDSATDQALVRNFASQLGSTEENPGKDRN